MRGERDNLLTLTSQCVDPASIDRSFNLCDPVGLSGADTLTRTLHNKRKRQTRAVGICMLTNSLHDLWAEIHRLVVDTERADTFTAVGICQCVV